MNFHIVHYRFKKLKRAYLIWITLISLLVNLWLDNTRFTIFQTNYNKKNNIIPKTISKSKENILAQTAVAQEKKTTNKFVSNLEIDPVIKNMSKIEIKKIMEKNSLEMTKSAEKLDFYEAARLRDENIELMKIIENKS